MEFIIHLGILILLYIIVIESLNIVLGFTGILHLAHPTFWGLGAYSYAISSINGWGFFESLFLAGIVASFAGFLLSLPALKLKSHYIGITTLGFLYIVNTLLISSSCLIKTSNFKICPAELTRGSLGIPGIPRPSIFGFEFTSNLSLFFLVLIITVICMVAMYLILHSPFGKILHAIRQDEIAVKSIGKDVVKYKIQAFVVAAFFAGISGALFATFKQFIHPVDFNVITLTLFIVMVVFGGMASYWGSILGAFVIALIPELLRFLPLPAEIVGPMRFLIYGLIIILLILFKPEGILGKKSKLLLIK